MGIKKIRILIIILSIILALSIIAIAGILYSNYYFSTTSTTVVRNNVIMPDTKTLSVNTAPYITAYAAEDEGSAFSLYKTNAEENTPFQVSNMFPGDSITKNYLLRVSHNGTVTVRYHADIRDGYEKLAQALMIKIDLGGKTLYDGIMRDIPEAVTHSLTSQSNTTDELKYAITVYLDTSAGNEYQNQKLIADFRWWVEGDEQGNLSFPQTGENNLFWVLAGIVCVSALLLILMLKKRQKGEFSNGK